MLCTGGVAALQLTIATDSTIELRALASAPTLGQIQDLRGREKLLAFLPAEYAHKLLQIPSWRAAVYRVRAF